MLHPCSDDPRHFREEDNEKCLEKLSRIIDITKGATFLGSGRYGAGVVFHGNIPAVFNAPKQIVVKYGYESKRDVEMGCEANAYHKTTPLFVKTYGWAQCTTVPKPWWPSAAHIETMREGELRDYFETGTPQDPMLFVFMAYGGKELQACKNSEWSLHDVRCAAFDFFWGILQARTTSGMFNHRDVKNDNVTVETFSEPKARFYGPFRVESKYQLHLIDLGVADYICEEYCDDPSSDLLQFCDIRYNWRPGHFFMQRLKSHDAKMAWGQFCARVNAEDELHRSGETDALQRFIEEDVFFRPLQTPACNLCLLQRVDGQCSSCDARMCTVCFDAHKYTC